jgi:hypothetical protein
VARGAAVACGPDAVLDLPLGTVASRALTAHAEAFGPVADAVLECAACGAQLDVALPLLELVVDAGDATVKVDELTVRAPTLRDLLDGPSEDELLARCVHGGTVAPEQRAAVEAAAETLAGAAGLSVRTQCPECGAEATAGLDPGALLWERVTSAVPSVLGEVAELAIAFAWSEAEILALSPARRQAYLDLARAGR